MALVFIKPSDGLFPAAYFENSSPHYSNWRPKLSKHKQRNLFKPVLSVKERLKLLFSVYFVEPFVLFCLFFFFLFASQKVNPVFFFILHPHQISLTQMKVKLAAEWMHGVCVQSFMEDFVEWRLTSSHCNPTCVLLLLLLLLQVCVPWVQPGLCHGRNEEPRSCGERSPGHPAGGRSGEGGSPMEGACLQEWMHPGEVTKLSVCAFPACFFKSCFT